MLYIALVGTTSQNKYLIAGFLRGVVMNFVQLAGVFVSCVSFVLGKKYWIKMRQKIGR